MNIEKKISKAGSITLPSSLRRELGIREKEKVAITVTEDGDINLKRIAGSCIFCESCEELVTYEKRFICKVCAEKIGGLLNDK